MEAVRGTNFDDIFDATGFGIAGAINVGSLGNVQRFRQARAATIPSSATATPASITSSPRRSVTVDLETSPIGTTNASHRCRQRHGAAEGTDSFTGVNAVQGSMFGDTLLGSSFSNTFTGLGGDDYHRWPGRVRYGRLQQPEHRTGGITVNMAAGTVTGDASIGTDTLR